MFASDVVLLSKGEILYKIVYNGCGYLAVITATLYFERYDYDRLQKRI